MKKMMIIVSSVFLSIGAILIFLELLIFARYAEFKSHADLVYAQVVHRDVPLKRDGTAASADNAHVFVCYKYEGKVYGPTEIDGFTRSLYAGDHVKVYVDRNNPNSIVRSGGGFGPVQLVLLIIGVVAVFMGGGSLIAAIRSFYGSRRLVKTGEKLTGKVDGFGRDNSVSINGESPWVVECSWTNPQGEELKFQSKRLDTNPSYTIKPGDEISIYVDRNDMKKYYVDVDEKLSKVHDM